MYKNAHKYHCVYIISWNINIDSIYCISFVYLYTYGIRPGVMVVALIIYIRIYPCQGAQLPVFVLASSGGRKQFFLIKL